MEPKKCEYSKTVMAGFLAISLYMACCGSWLLSMTLIFITVLHLVDVRRKNRRYQWWLDNKEKAAMLTRFRRKW